MAIWKEPTSPKTDSPAVPQSNTVKLDDVAITPPTNPNVQYRSNGPTTKKESIIAAELTIEGKIQGSGHIRVAGHFKGDVHVDGDLTIESGAMVIGSVRARTVVIGGELEGNIDEAAHVELLETGVLNGDLKAGSFVVARGSRMRGQVVFGWDDTAASLRQPIVVPAAKMESFSAS